MGIGILAPTKTFILHGNSFILLFWPESAKLSKSGTSFVQFAENIEELANFV